MSEYIKKEDILSAAVEVEYLGRQRMMVSVAKIGQMETAEIVRCRDCRRRSSCVTFEGIADYDGYCSMGVRDE